MNDGYLDYLEDILDAMGKAEVLLENVEFAKFESDFRINFAVVRALEIIGEAAKRVPDSVREQHPHIPWKSMAGMRDRIIHGYDSVDMHIVWNVVKNDIPQLKPQIAKVLNDAQS